MFSTGHLMWIAISIVFIICALVLCLKKKPDIDRMLKVCFVIGICSETVKVFSVARILPMVTPIIEKTADIQTINYTPTGQFSPYLEMAHLPLELCSLQMLFILVVLISKKNKWKRRFLALINVTGSLGGIMGILFAYVTADYHTVSEYFLSPRVWQFFLYHIMLVVLGLYLGFSGILEYSVRDFRDLLCALFSMDFLTFYLNSIFSQPVYVNEKPVGLVYRANFFSSYVNPLGIVLTEKWQWILYLLIRMILVLVLTYLLIYIQSFYVKHKYLPGKDIPGGKEK